MCYKVHSFYLSGMQRWKLNYEQDAMLQARRLQVQVLMRLLDIFQFT
jgi:hypothetical protein